MSKKKSIQKSTTPIVKLSYPLLYLQAGLTIVMLILAVMTLFHGSMLPWFELSLGITLLDIALNNALFYKRNGGTILYTLIGIILLALSIIELLGEIL